MSTTFKIGDQVRLKPEQISNNVPEGREDNATAKIRELLGHGGVVTDRDLNGCRYWHMDHLVLNTTEMKVVKAPSYLGLRQQYPKAFAIKKSYSGHGYEGIIQVNPDEE